MSKLEIIDLHVSIEGKEILKGVNLSMNTNEFHVIMGPNGTGKSTLAATIMGHYKYQVTKGQILLDGEDVLSMSVDERSRKGLFLAMQYPNEIPAITKSDFIKNIPEDLLERIHEELEMCFWLSSTTSAELRLYSKEECKAHPFQEGFDLTEY